jgi:hypothetical protein
MSSAAFRFGPPAGTLLFALLAFIFSMLAITSREWAVRDNFNPDVSSQFWDKPIYTLYRSPFIVCGVNPRNVSTAVAATATPSPIYDVSCDHYKPFGRDKTSCEPSNATGSDTAANVGDQRMCQQIHLAGNYGITSTFFIGIGFLATGALVLLGLSSRSASAPASNGFVGGRSPSGSGGAGMLPYLSLATLVFLFVGVVTALVSQFYGILGFMISLPNQSDFASSSGTGGSNEVDVHGAHGPWYQGKALSIYVTLAWAFSIAAGTLASMTWQLPSWQAKAASSDGGFADISETVQEE